MSVLFVTGAGISANAGIPTYRDKGSSWTDKDLEKKSHSTKYGMYLDELWDKHWGPVSAQMLVAQPTHAHKAIAEFQKDMPSIIATQNIDTLHEQAGSDNVAHVHGEMTAICMKCKGKNIHTWLGVGAPNCADCGSTRTRPDVVLFGEMLNRKQFRGLDRFAKVTASHVVAVGTSLNVFPVAGLVMDVCSSSRIKTIIINKDKTPFDSWVTEAIHGDADDIIDDVLNKIKKEKDNN